MNDHKTNLKFVREIEKRPWLFNYSLPTYSQRELTESAWIEIGKEVNMTVSECKDRWKNVKAVFGRHIRAKENGSKYKKSYYLEDAMQFVIPFMRTLSKGAESKSTVSLDDDDDQLDNFCDIIEERVDVVDESRVSVSPAPCQQSPLRYSESGSPSPHPVMATNVQKQKEEHNQSELRNHRKRKAEDNIIGKTITEYFEAKKAKLSMSMMNGAINNPKSEALKMFLLSLTPDLESMSDNQVRQFKKKCLQLVEEIISGKS